MTGQAILTFREGSLDIPPAVQSHFHLVEGAKLRLTFVSEETAVLEAEAAPKSVKRGWRSFRGFLKDYPPKDTSAIRAEERAWELAHDRRKYGLTGK